MTGIESLPELLTRRTAAAQTVRFSPQGLLFVGDTEHQLEVFDGGCALYRLDLRARSPKARTVDRIRSLAFAPDGSQFYVASGPSIQAFQTDSGRRLWSFGLPRFLGFLIACPLSVDVDNSGRLAIANDNGTFGLRDHFGRRLRCWKHNAAPRWLVFSNDGHLLLGSDSFSLRGWDTETGELVRGFDLSERVYGLAASKVLPLMAIRTLHEVQLFDLQADSPVSMFPVEPGMPLVSFAANAPLLGFSSEHGIEVVKIDPSDYSRTEVIFRSRALDTTLLSITFTPDADKIVAGCGDGTVRAWKLT